jgi:hypothetical protein
VTVGIKVDIHGFNSPPEPVLPVDATVLRFNSPAEPACIFYGRTWDLNFGARTWFSGLEISTLGPGHGFQDLGSQLWGLDFHTRGFQDRNLKTFRT